MSDRYRYRFGSQTNTKLFEEALTARRAPFSAIGYDVVVDGWFDGLEDLVREFSGWEIAADRGYSATGGGQDAGFQDTAAQSVRSNPPQNSRGGWPPDYYSRQIVSQGGFPPRRATWCQPDIPLFPSGMTKKEKMR